MGLIIFPSGALASQFRFMAHYDVQRLLALRVFPLAPNWKVLIIGPYTDVDELSLNSVVNSTIIMKYAELI